MWTSLLVKKLFTVIYWKVLLTADFIADSLLRQSCFSFGVLFKNALCVKFAILFI